MTIEYSADDAIVQNDTLLSGTPAIRITGANIRFVNQDDGDVRGTSAASAAIVIQGSGATIENLLGGEIRMVPAVSGGAAILGSAFADTILNAGVIAGLRLGEGNDVVVNSGSVGTAELGGGDDSYDASGGGTGFVYGGAGNDTITGGNASGGAYYGEAGDDQITGGSGSDVIYGGSGNDVMRGGGGNDGIYFNGSDEVHAGAGNDHIRLDFGGAGGTAVLNGDAGDDEFNVVQVSEQFQTIIANGGADNDIFQILLPVGHLAADFGDGNDELQLTEIGTAVLTLGAGEDLIRLQNGFARFLAENGAPAGGRVAIADFQAGDGGDRIALSGFLAAATGLWNQTGNPFALGFLSLAADNGDTLIVLDRDAGGAGASQTLMRLVGVAPASLTAWNLGYAPDGSATAGRVMSGTAGQDRVVGLSGGDTIEGLAGEDRLFGEGGDDIISGGADGDWIEGGIGNDHLRGNDGRDYLYAGDGDDIVEGGLGDDWLEDYGTLNRGGGSDVLDGGEGNDTILVYRALGESWSTMTLRGGIGDDRFTVHLDSKGAVTLDAGAGADSIMMFGQDFTARVTLGAGQDKLELANLYNLAEPKSSLVVTDFQAGDLGDRIDWSSSLAPSLTNDKVGDNPFVTGHMRLLQSGAHTLVQIDRDGGANSFATLLTLENVDSKTLTRFNFGHSLPIVGTENAEILTGTTDQDLIQGLGGNDTLHGLGANDVIDGGAGEDWMYGGAGDDIYYVDEFMDRPWENADEGIDEVRTTGHFYLTWSPNVENLTGLSASNMLLTGNELNNVIRGGDEGDIINGAGGDDTMIGGKGFEIYYVDSVGDTIIELAGEGIDQIRTSLATYTLGEHLESLWGDESSQTLTGNAGDNMLYGRGGGDTMIGLGGDDRYIVAAGDTIVEQAGGGRDGVHTDLTVYTLPDNVEELSSNGTEQAYTFTGNGLDNLITGHALNDVIDGGAGADRMSGWVGDDIYYVDNVGDTIDDFMGTDEVRTTLAEFDLKKFGSIENLTGIRGETQVLIGNDLANVITGGSHVDRIAGGDGNDRLVGNGGGDTLNGEGGDDHVIGGGGANTMTGDAGNDRLEGGDDDDHMWGGIGDDLLDGGASGDQMTGGTGNDIYVVDDAADKAIEAAGEGTDEVRTALASLSIAGYANVEKLTGTSAAGQALTGNAGANEIAGGTGNDVLDGGAGGDAMRGGLGDDVYIVDDLGDQALEAEGEGRDEIRTSLAAYTLVPGTVEQLRGTSDAGQKLTGNYGDDTIIGAAGDDVLNGFFGDDTLEGGQGNDTLVGHGGFDTLRGGAGDDVYFIDAGDTIVEYAGEGLDTVVTQAEIFVLTGALENLRAGSDIAHDFRGHSGNNVIVGGEANDMIRAQDGGGDLLFGKGGVDSFYMGAAFANDDFVDGGDNRDSLILQGDYSAGLTLTWNITGGTSIANIESLSLLSGSVTQYGDTAGNLYSYDLTLVDANIAAGALFKVNGFNLRAGENLTFDASAETDAQLQILAGLGTDTLVGGAMGDAFVFGHDGRFGHGDTVNGGGGLDVLYLRGDYVIDFNAAGYAGSLTSVESIALLTSANNEFAGGGDGEFDYVITWNDAMLANGVNMSVNGSRLGANESFVFDGSSETGGNLRVFGGAAADTLTTGGGNDILYGGGGADVLTSGAGIDIFRYQAVSDSTAAAKDTIHGFAKGSDRIDVARIDADAGTAADEAFAFIGSNAFTAAGQLRAFNVSGDLWQVEGDVNGDGTADLVIQVHVEAGQMLGAGDFML